MQSIPQPYALTAFYLFKKIKITVLYLERLKALKSTFRDRGPIEDRIEKK